MLKKNAVMRFWKKGTPDKVKKRKLRTEIFRWGSEPDSSILPNVSEYKYLGMKLDSDLDWVAHMKHTKKYWKSRARCDGIFTEKLVTTDCKL